MPASGLRERSRTPLRVSRALPEASGRSVDTQTTEDRMCLRQCRPSRAGRRGVLLRTVVDRGGGHAVVCCQELLDFDAIDLDRDDAVGEIDFDELTDVFEHEPPGRLSCHRGVQVPDFLDWDDIPDDDASHVRFVAIDFAATTAVCDSDSSYCRLAKMSNARLSKNVGTTIPLTPGGKGPIGTSTGTVTLSRVAREAFARAPQRGIVDVGAGSWAASVCLAWFAFREHMRTQLKAIRADLEGQRFRWFSLWRRADSTSHTLLIPEAVSEQWYSWKMQSLDANLSEQDVAFIAKALRASRVGLVHVQVERARIYGRRCAGQILSNELLLQAKVLQTESAACQKDFLSAACQILLGPTSNVVSLQMLVSLCCSTAWTGAARARGLSKIVRCSSMIVPTSWLMQSFAWATTWAMRRKLAWWMLVCQAR